MSNSKLPERPSLDYLRKLAKKRLQDMRRANPDAHLAAAQFEIAKEHGATSWRALKVQLDAPKKGRVESPAVRFLHIVDLERSVAFYKDVLGFHVTMREDGADAILGPTQLRLGCTGHSSIVFLQVGNVGALHTALMERGASPSQIEKVNWIKMLMFEVRDPDANILWFGQSYHKHPENPSRGKGQPSGMQQALPELPVGNVTAAVEYYRDVLGFKINYQQDDIGVMDRDAITILLIKRTKPNEGIGSFGVYVEDADALYNELLAKGAQIDGRPVSHLWGLRDFRVFDLDGNRITLAQRFE